MKFFIKKLKNPVRYEDLFPTLPTTGQIFKWFNGVILEDGIIVAYTVTVDYNQAKSNLSSFRNNSHLYTVDRIYKDMSNNLNYYPVYHQFLLNEINMK